jgi:hypothetical protein
MTYPSFISRHNTVQKVVTWILVTREECLRRSHAILLVIVNISGTQRAHSFR